MSRCSWLSGELGEGGLSLADPEDAGGSASMLKPSRWIHSRGACDLVRLDIEGGHHQPLGHAELASDSAAGISLNPCDAAPRVGPDRCDFELGQFAVCFRSSRLRLWRCGRLAQRARRGQVQDECRGKQRSKCRISRTTGHGVGVPFPGCGE